MSTHFCAEMGNAHETNKACDAQMQRSTIDKMNNGLAFSANFKLILDWLSIKPLHAISCSQSTLIDSAQTVILYLAHSLSQP